jgi:TANFOR domain-containing protein
MKKNIVLCVLCLAGFAAFAQQPVQVTTLLRPPYTLQLSDYYASTQEKLVVVLTNRDLNKPMLQVRLRMSIESQTVQLRTRDYASFPILSLEAGVPLRLSLSDLAPYFNLENLDFNGITRAEYQMQAKLPEGFYQFCFEAIEVSTNQVASARSCGMAWMSLSDPPLLNIPRKGEAIAQKEPQNIIFQWTPRHLNSPNSAFVTEYDFQLVEFWDNTLAPEVAFQSAQPLYEVTTRATTLLYGPSQPLLLSGHRYGWRVQAHVQNGVEASDVFRNQGYSEIYWFTFQDVCPPPMGVSATNGTFGNLEFSWLPNSRHTGYMVTYREKNKDGAVWFDQQSATTSALVYDVQAGKTYEYRVGGFCKTDQPVLSELHTITIPARESDNFVNCSIVPDPQIANRAPLTVLQQGDVITAGSFPVKLSNVGGAGSFSGRGYVIVPFLGRAKVHVTFDNIQVNTDKQLIAGTVITSYDAGEGSVIDIDEGLDIFHGYQGIVSHLQDLHADTDRDELEKVLDRVVENAEKELPAEQVEHVKNNVDELLGAKDTYDEAKEAYNALPDGDPKKEELAKEVAEAKKQFDEIKSRFDGADKDAVTGEKYTLMFDRINTDPPIDQSAYGWDAYNQTRNASHYEKSPQTDVEEYIPWKAVPQGGSDWVQIVSRNAGELPENMLFRSATGTITPKTESVYIKHLKVSGYGEGQTNQVIAYEQKDVDGKTVNIERAKVNVVSYQKMYRKLVIVPTNDEVPTGSREEIEKALNKIYSEAVVEWRVEISRPLRSQYDLNNNGMEIDPEPGETFGLYTAEMTQVLNDFVLREPFDPDAHYMFVVGRGANPEVLGYNPFKRQAGFMFMQPQLAESVDNFAHTLAHEIGHGAFRLYHTFEDILSGTLPKRSTNNLMDYLQGNALDKYQWDIIHDPPIMLSLFGNTTGQEQNGTGEPVAQGDPFEEKVRGILKEYQQNVEAYTGGQGALATCLESHKKQLNAVRQNIDDVVASKDSLTAFTQGVKDQVLNLLDDGEWESVVCASLTARLQDFDLLFVYNDVQYKDGESIYVTEEEDEIKLRVISDEPSIVLDAENVDWEGATGTGRDAVVAMADTNEGDKVVTVEAESVKAEVTIKTGYVKLTADKYFAPTEENLDIFYDITPGKSGEWKYAKLEVFDKYGSTPIYVNTTVARKGAGVKFSWDGKINTGVDKDHYIDVFGSPYKVKLTVGMDEKYSKSYSDEKQVRIEIASITMTPDGPLNLVKPSTSVIYVTQEVEALVKVRNKKGQGVVTALPIGLKWRYEDPDDVANDIKKIVDRNGPAGNDNTSEADGGRLGGWQPVYEYTSRIDGVDAYALTNVMGANKGKSKMRFLSSVIAGDNYIIVVDVLDQSLKAVKSAKTGIWTVRKKVANERIYEMPGSLSMAKMMSKENIDPAFSKDGCTDYSVASTITTLPAKSVKTFMAEIVPPTEAQLPTKDELYILSHYDGNYDKWMAAKTSVTQRAQSWFDLSEMRMMWDLNTFASENGIKEQSVVSVHYFHPKLDGDDATGQTDFYPYGIAIKTGAGMIADPDEDWKHTQGVEQQGKRITWFFKNSSIGGGDKRLQIVGRHEVGHRSDHKPFNGNSGGDFDHSAEGLMTPTSGATLANPAGIPEFSADSINKLRGRNR